MTRPAAHLHTSRCQIGPCQHDVLPCFRHRRGSPLTSFNLPVPAFMPCMASHVFFVGRLNPPFYCSFPCRFEFPSPQFANASVKLPRIHPSINPSIHLGTPYPRTPDTRRLFTPAICNIYPSIQPPITRPLLTDPPRSAKQLLTRSCLPACQSLRLPGQARTGRPFAHPGATGRFPPLPRWCSRRF